MTESGSDHNIIASTLATMDYQNPGQAGIFDYANAMLKSNGYHSAAVYLADEYPDVLHKVSSFGDGNAFPEHVIINDHGELRDNGPNIFPPRKGLLTFPMFSHGRFVGVFAVVDKDGSDSNDRVLTSISHIIEMLAYIEVVRAKCQRERTERELYFAHSLINRLLIHTPPETSDFRLGFELWRTLESGGEFFDFVPIKDGRVYAFIGKCSGRGLKTALEATEIMHHIDRSFISMESLLESIHKINDHLVRVKKRSHLVSLCLFEINPATKSMRIARAGNFAISICRSGICHNISKSSGVFLGMLNHIDIQEELFEFAPGSVLFCATEGIHSLCDNLDHPLPDGVIAGAMEKALRSKAETPFVNAVFDQIKALCDFSMQRNPVAAISVEFRED